MARRSTKSDSPASYNDVKFVLDLAVEKPGLQYVLSTPGRAVNFKQRCNKFRSLMRELAAEQLQGMPGFRAETVYDPLLIRQVDANLQPSREGCIILFEHQELTGKLIDPETGKEIELPGVTDVLKEF